MIPFAGLTTTDHSTRAALLGICDATQSSYADDCENTPHEIREAYDGDCYNPFTERMVDCTGKLGDLGNWSPSGLGFTTDAGRYREAIDTILGAKRTPFAVGGDHAITPPLVSGFQRHQPIHVVQWDAHPDLYPDFKGNRDSHACVAARLLEFKFVLSITQIGIRTETPVQREVRDAHAGRVHCITANEAARRTTLLDHLPDGARIYLTVDMDGFDPSVAPEVAHAVPGGLSGRAGIDLIHEIGDRHQLVGMDVVEACPGGDQRTLLLAARLIHEGVGLVV